MANEPAPAAPPPPAPGKIQPPAPPKALIASMTKGPVAPKPVASQPPPPAPAPGEPPPPKNLVDGVKGVTKDIFEPKAPPADLPKPAAGDPIPDPKPAPAPAPAPAPGEVDAFAHIAEPANLQEGGKSGWKALKKEANDKVRAAEAKYATAAAELDTLKKAAPADVAEVERLRADVNAAHDRLAVLDIESHPTYQQQYIAPKKKALTEAQGLITDYGIADAPALASLLTKPRTEFAKTISDLAAKMPLADQHAFMANMRDAYRLEGEGKAALANSGELAQQLQSKTAQTQRKAFDETIADFESKVKPRTVPENATPEERAEAEDFNQALASFRTAAAKNSFGKLTDKEVAEVSTKAAALDLVAQKVIPAQDRYIARQNKIIADLVAELEAIKGLKAPPVPGGSGGSGEPDVSNMSIKQMTKHILEGGGRR